MIFIMRGTSCSGKDTFINQYFPHPEHVVSSDYYRKVLLGSDTIQRQNGIVFDFIHKIIETRLQNKLEWTVYNATNLRMKDASVVVELCKKYKTPYTFISINPPDLEELIKRSEKRGSENGLLVPETILERHYNRYHEKNNQRNFIEEAVNSPLCTYIEIDQNYDVIKHIN